MVFRCLYVKLQINSQLCGSCKNYYLAISSKHVDKLLGLLVLDVLTLSPSKLLLY